QGTTISTLHFGCAVQMQAVPQAWTGWVFRRGDDRCNARQSLTLFDQPVSTVVPPGIGTEHGIETACAPFCKLLCRDAGRPGQEQGIVAPGPRTVDQRLPQPGRDA